MNPGQFNWLMVALWTMALGQAPFGLAGQFLFGALIGMHLTLMILTIHEAYTKIVTAESPPSPGQAP